MSDDLVKRLRAVIQSNGHTGLCREAADAIERLTAERDAAWEAGATWMQEKVCAWAESGGVGGNHLSAQIRALTSNKSATVQRCSRLSCGLREMKTEPPLDPPLMVCDQADCDRSIRAVATSKPE